MEEIGFRFAVFPFEGMAGHQAEYIAWLLGRALKEAADAAVSIEPIAVDLLAARLRTPLQIEQYLTRAFEETFRVGEKIVTATMVEAVLSRQIDDLEPRLTRYGYDVKSIAEDSASSRPMSGCSYRANSTRPARGNSPSRCSSPACRCEARNPSFSCLVRPPIRLI